jgi:hypothetical protein
MQRAEWCLDDYIITDKLYKGYASMGTCRTLAGRICAQGSSGRSHHAAALHSKKQQTTQAAVEQLRATAGVFQSVSACSRSELRMHTSGTCRRAAGCLVTCWCAVLCCCCAVYKAICKRSREVVVLKCYLMSSICELYQHQIYREVRLHSTCNHENIINLFAAFQVCVSCTCSQSHQHHPSSLILMRLQQLPLSAVEQSSNCPMMLVLDMRTARVQNMLWDSTLAHCCHIMCAAATCRRVTVW